MKSYKPWMFLLACALVCGRGTTILADDLLGQGPVYDARPTIRFCEYNIDPNIIEEQPVFKPPVGQEVVPNSYWEQEQAAPGKAPAAAPAPAQTPSAMLSEIPSPSPMCCGALTDTDCAGCGQCAGCIKEKLPPPHLVAMVEGTFLWPQFHRPFLNASITNSVGTFNGFLDSAHGSAEGTMMASPRISAGVQWCKWGIIGRYWAASNFGSGFTPALTDSPIPGVTGFDGLRAYTLDLEVTRRFVGCKWITYLFGGVRNGSLDNDSTVIADNSFNGIVQHASAFTGQQFNGTGLTFGVWGHRKIHECSPLSFFYVNRYSFLWGTQHASAQTSASVLDPNLGFAQTLNGAAASGSGSLFIGELQFGLQWCTELKCMPGTAFLRTGVEYQYWDTTSSTTAQAQSTAFADDSVSTASAIADNLLFHLIGFNIGAGILY